jgi:RTX calcium-binding nonapeptide repeat (4 copies)
VFDCGGRRSRVSSAEHGPNIGPLDSDVTGRSLVGEMGRRASRLGDEYAAAAAVAVGVCLWLGMCVPALGSVQPGEIFVADPEAGEDGKGAIVRVDRASGAQTIVSSGGQFGNPTGVTVGPAGELFVADADALGGNGAVFRIDPATGAQQVISSGGAFVQPTGIAANCCLIVVADPDTDPSDPSGGDGGVIDIDPETGRQSPGPRPVGEALVDPSGVALSASVGLLFTDSNAGKGGSGAAYHVTSLLGTLDVSRIAGEGNLVDPVGVTHVPSGFAAEPVAVSDPNAAGGAGAVIGFRFSGPQRVWSSGGSFSDPSGIAFRAGPPSELLVADQSARAGAVFSVDPFSGTQALVSSAGSFAKPTGIAVVPPTCRGSFADNPGSDGPDAIGGGGIVAALGGDDEVTGEGADDLVCGDDGNDRIESEPGTGAVYGDDVYVGGEGDDELIGGFEAKDKLLGTQGDDRVSGDGGRDRVSGGDGKDKVSGGTANDNVGGGRGGDRLTGGKGRDVLKGGKGRDVCIGGGGSDRASNCEKNRGI